MQQRKTPVGGLTQSGLPTGYLETVTGHVFILMFYADNNALFFMRNSRGNDFENCDKEDGVLNIYDDGVVPSIIYFRIIEPRTAA